MEPSMASLTLNSLSFPPGSYFDVLVSFGTSDHSLLETIFPKLIWINTSLDFLLYFRLHLLVSFFKILVCLLFQCCHSVMLLFSCSFVSDSLRLHVLQHTRLPCHSLSPRVCSNSYPLSQWCYLAISSSATPFSFCCQSFQHQGLFQWIGSSHQVAKIPELQLQHQSFQWIFRVDLRSNHLALIPCTFPQYI